MKYNVPIINNRELVFAAIFKQFQPKICIELGVREACFSHFLLAQPSVEKLYGVDMDKCRMAIALENENPNKYKFVHARSPECAEGFPDNYFDFIYVDDCHIEEHVYPEMLAWWPKLKIGGIFSGHDYMKITLPGEGKFGVIEAVNRFCAEKEINFVLTGLPEDARLQDKIDLGYYQGGELAKRFAHVKPDGFVEPPSWFFVKEKE